MRMVPNTRGDVEAAVAQVTAPVVLRCAFEAPFASKAEEQISIQEAAADVRRAINAWLYEVAS